MKPIRILHIVAGMNRGGVETWLMHVLRNIDRQHYQMDFLVQTKETCAYDEEIKKLGSRIIPCFGAQQPWRFANNFAKILKDYGPYDVIHSHVSHYSGFVLRLAAYHHIPIRIAHIHTAGSQKKNNFLRSLYEKLMKHWIKKYVTHGIGISETAAEYLFESNWKQDKRFRILLYGFDFARFGICSDKSSLKTQLGLSPNTKVIGHVGRFVPVKNHHFLIQVFKQLLTLGIDAHLLLVGKGPLEKTIREQLEVEDIAEQCSLLAERDNIAPIMGCMDLMVFPSQYEGLGIVVLEAQAAGVRTLASTAIPSEVDVIPAMVKRLSLDAGVDVWAKTAYELLQLPNIQSELCLPQVNSSAFGIYRCINELCTIYQEK